MAHVSKLLNYVKVNNTVSATFFSELHTDIKKGDKVYIIGGSYDNTCYTDKASELYNIFHPYAGGYTVLSVDDKGLSNGITLSISITDIEEVGEDALISLTYMRKGTINGGVIEGAAVGEPDSRDMRINTRLDDTPAVLYDTAVRGGDILSGNLTTRSDSQGFKQELNTEGGIEDLKDSNKFNIKEYTDNNNSIGYGTVLSGVFGKIFDGYMQISVYSSSSSVTLPYVPHKLKEIIANSLNADIKIYGIKNTRTYKITGISGNTLYLEPYEDDTIHTESGEFRVVLISSNTVLNTEVLDAEIWGSEIKGGDIKGGEIRWATLTKGQLSSESRTLVWHDGIFMGNTDESYAKNIVWENGWFKGGVWQGDALVSILDIKPVENGITIFISEKYKDLFALNEKTLVSYIKDIETGEYIKPYDDMDNTSINSIYTLTDVMVSGDTAVLTLEGSIPSLEGIDFTFGKVSQSTFKKGVIETAVWDGGLFDAEGREVQSMGYIGTSDETRIYTETSNIKEGDKFVVSNQKVLRRLRLPDSEGNPYFRTITESFTKVLTVLTVESTYITVSFEELDPLPSNTEWDTDGSVIGFSKAYINKGSYIYSTVWKNTDMRAGVFSDGVFTSGSMTSYLHFDKDSQDIVTVFRDGWIISADINNAMLAGGTAEYLNLNDGTVTNSTAGTYMLDGLYKGGDIKRGNVFGGTVKGSVLKSVTVSDTVLESGEYTAGYGLYPTVTQNRSGNKITGRYSSLSAPSVIYIDSTGKVKFDQKTYYQKDNQIIFQDFGNFKNPFNNQLFTVLDVNHDTSELYIDYNNMSDNPLYQIEDFQNNRPMLSIFRMDDFSQVSENEYWIIDRKFGRIIIDNTASNKPDVITDIKDLRLITSDSEWIYVLYSTTVRRYLKSDRRQYTDLSLPSEISGISACNNILFMTSGTKVYYTDFSYIKELLIVCSDIKAYDINGNIALCTLKDKLYLHNLLTGTDFTVSDTVPIPNIDGKPSTFDVLYNNTLNKHTVWCAASNNLYKIEYTSSLNYKKINREDLGYTVSKLKVSFNNELLNITIQKDGRPLHLISGQQDIDMTGFGDTLSSIKLLDGGITSDSDIKKMWYYDKPTSRLMHIDESDPSVYREESIVDIQGEVKKLITTLASDSVFAITENDGIYYMLYKQIGFPEQVLKITNTAKIYDAVYFNDLYILVYDITNNRYAVLKGNMADGTQDISDFDSILHYQPAEFVTDSSLYKTAEPCFDIIPSGDIMLSVLYTGFGVIAEGVYGSTVYNFADRITAPDISDISLKEDKLYNGRMQYTMFITDTDSLYRVFSENIESDTDPLGYHVWCEPFTDPINTSKNIRYISKTVNNNILCILSGERFYAVNTYYTSYSSTAPDTMFYKNSTSTSAYGISHNRILLKNTSSMTTTLGIYNQNRNLDNATTYSENNITALNNAGKFCIPYKFFSSRQKYSTVFIDNTPFGKQVKVLSGSTVTNTLGYRDYKDMCYIEGASSKKIIIIAKHFDTTQFYAMTKGSYDLYYIGYLDGVYNRITGINNKIYILDTASNTIKYFTYGVDSTTPPPIPAYAESIIGYDSDIKAYATDNYTDIAAASNGVMIKNNSIIQYTTEGTSEHPLTVSLEKGEYSVFFNHSDEAGFSNFCTFNNTTNTGTVYNTSNILSSVNNDTQAEAFAVSGGYMVNVNNPSFNTAISNTPGQATANWVNHRVANLGDTELFTTVIDSKGRKFVRNPNVSSFKPDTALYQNMKFRKGYEYSFRLDIKTLLDDTDPATLNIILGFNEADEEYAYTVNDYITSEEVHEFVFTPLSDHDNIAIQFSNDEEVIVELYSFDIIDTTSNSIFIANNKSGNRGIMKDFMKETVSADSNYQVNMLITEDITKVSPVSDTVCYALTEDSKLYKVDFVTNSYTLMQDPSPAFRDINEQYPVLADYDQYIKITDIAEYNGNLAVLYKTATKGSYNAYNIAVLNANNSYTYYSDDIDFLFVNKNAIDIDGVEQTVRVGDNSGFGGIKHLFASSQNPKMDIKNSNFFLYFGEGTYNILVKMKSAQHTVLYSNTANGCAVKVKTNGIGVTGHGATFYTATLDGPVSYITGNKFYGTFTVGSETVTLEDDEMVVVFDNGINPLDNGSYQVSVYGAITDITGVWGSEAANISASIAYNGDVMCRISSAGEFVATAPYGSYGDDLLYYNTTYLPNTRKIAASDTSTLGNNLYAAIQSPGVVTSIFTQVYYSEDESIESKVLYTKGLDKIDYTYETENITKGYSYQDGKIACSPYATNRILENCVIKDGFKFNKGGTPYTAHVINSLWESTDRFVGGWNTASFKDNSPLQSKSLFTEGVVTGNVYGGFIVGGEVGSNTEQAYIKDTHIAGLTPITVKNTIIDSGTRYDITGITKEQYTLTVDVEALDFNSVYSDTVAEISTSTVIRMPSVFRKNRIKIVSASMNPVNPDYTVITLGEDISNISSLLSTEIFIYGEAGYENLFGFFDVVNTEDRAITIKYNMTDFDTDYIEFKDAHIRIADFMRPSAVSYDGNKCSLTFSMSCDIEIFEKLLKKNVDLINNKVAVQDIMRVYTQSVCNASLTISSDISNVYIESSELSCQNALNCLIQQSDITCSTLTDNILVSGNISGSWNSGVWLNHDDQGYSNAVSSFTGDMLGGNGQITAFYFDDIYMWIEVDTVLPFKKGSFVNIRGFSGEKSTVIGSNRSVGHKVIDTDGQFVKIKNPFILYDHNPDFLTLSKQTMLMKNSNAEYITINKTEIKNVKNSQFSVPITSENNGWYTVSSESGAEWNWSYSRAICDNWDNNSVGKYIRQDYLFIDNVDYTLSVEVSEVSAPAADEDTFFEVVIGEGQENEIRERYDYQDFYGTDIKTIAFTASGQQGIAIRSGVRSKTVVREVAVTSDDNIDNYTQDFNFAYASVTAFNGGTFDGTIDSVWNAGEFVGGTMSGKWFGSFENYGFGFETDVYYNETEEGFDVMVKLDETMFEDQDFVYLSYIDYYSIDSKENNESVYGTAGYITFNGDTFLGLMYTSKVNISGKHKVQVTKYMTRDFNSNMKINPTLSEQQVLDNNIDNTTDNKYIRFENDYVIIPDYINKALTSGQEGSMAFDLWFMPDSTDKTPILNFGNTDYNNYGIKLYAQDSNLILIYTDQDYIEKSEVIGSVANNVWSHAVFHIIDSTLYYSLDGGVLGSINDFFVGEYNLNFIGRINNSISASDYSTGVFGLDELRFWNTDMRNYFDEFSLYKFQNRYIKEIVGYYNFDSVYDDKYYYPEQEYYFEMKSGFKEVVKDSAEYTYGGKDIFVEAELFVGKTEEECKFFTIEEYKEISSGDRINDFSYTKFFAEFFVKVSNNDANKFNIVVREKVCNGNKDTLIEANFNVNGNTTIDDLRAYAVTTQATSKEFLLYPLDDTNVYDAEVYTLLDNIDLDFDTFNKLKITDTAVYADGEMLGNYVLRNRNVFKYSNRTKMIVGGYGVGRYGDDFSGFTPVTYNSVQGFIKNLTIKQLLKDTDNDYDIYTIKSGENTDYFNENRSNLLDNTYMNVPRWEDGQQKWDYTVNLGGEDARDDKIDDAMPHNTWLDGDDWKDMDTDSGLNVSGTLFENYFHILTKDFNNPITLTNMDNFKFFGKKISDEDGNVLLNVTDSGYLLFGDLQDNNSFYPYPYFHYLDIDKDWVYNNTATSDAIMLNSIIDVRTSEGGFVKYTDREDEFVIQFCGKSSNINVTGGDEEDFENNKFIIDNSANDKYSFFAIRIDKVNSSILFYIRRLGESEDQKYVALQRQDKYTRKADGFYKRPVSEYIDSENVVRPEYQGDSDFVVGYESEDADVVSYKDSQYILYMPRWIDYEKDEAIIDIFEQEQSDKVYIDSILPVDYKYYNSLNNIDDFISGTNSNYSIAEQYDYTQSDAVVSRSSVFSDGKYEDNVWYNGILRGGKTNIRLWKHGIRHGGVITGDDDLAMYTHWLGGYNIGEDETALENIIWYRGWHYGGMFVKGQWFAFDYVLKHNNQQSMWEKGVWYSNYVQEGYDTEVNMISSFDSGTFESAGEWYFDSFNAEITRDNTISYTGDYSGRIIVDNPINNIEYNNAIKIAETEIIKVNKNTEYTVRVYVHNTETTYYTSTNNQGIIIYAEGEEGNIQNIKNIAKTPSKTFIMSDSLTEIIEDNDNKWTVLEHTFNSLDNSEIRINFKAYGTYFGTQTDKLYIDNMVMFGSPVVDDDNVYSVSNHNSVWHGGVWRSANKLKDIENNIYYFYSYESNSIKNFEVVGGTLTLPDVESVWLGGMWLRGEFRGGVMANCFWHSLSDVDVIFSTEYEQDVDAGYDEDASVFYKGLLLNSVWYGGTVPDSGDNRNVIFGDLSKYFTIKKIGEQDYKKSTNQALYKVLYGKKILKF